MSASPVHAYAVPPHLQDFSTLRQRTMSDSGQVMSCDQPIRWTHQAIVQTPRGRQDRATPRLVEALLCAIHNVIGTTSLPSLATSSGLESKMHLAKSSTQAACVYPSLLKARLRFRWEGSLLTPTWPAASDDPPLQVKREGLLMQLRVWQDVEHRWQDERRSLAQHYFTRSSGWAGRLNVSLATADFLSS